MKLRLAGLISGLLLLSPASALAGPSVTVRVEGQTHTLLERTRVTLPDAAPPVDGCDRYTPAAAIEEATHGNWDRQAFVSTILGESHTFANNDYWAEWLDTGNGYKYGAGICAASLKDGDEVLMLVDVSGSNFAPTVLPLAVEGVPAAVQTGTPVTVTVVDYVSATGTPGEGDRRPVDGATVTAGGATATTDAQGHATLTLAQPGDVVVKATKAPDAPSAGEHVTVTDAPPAPPAPPARDDTAPVARIAAVREQQHFARGKGPRTLAGTVADTGSGIAQVKLGLSWSRDGHCRIYSPTKERFRGAKCGRRTYFKVGDATDWSYLLPERLKRGRYVLDAVAIDKAGNRTPLARGTSRVVFFVR
jgi:hypothetical protein